MSTLKISVAAVLLVLLVGIANADLTQAQKDALETMPGGKLFVGVRTAQAVFPETEKFPYYLAIFEQGQYEYPVPVGKALTVKVNLDWYDLKLNKTVAPAGDWRIVYSGTGSFTNVGNHLECGEAPGGHVMVMVYNATNPRLCWVDSCHIRVYKTAPQ